MKKSNIGVYGLGVMGKSIALNIANHGYNVSGYNYENHITLEFAKNNSDIKTLNLCYSLEEFIESLESPKIILIMITAGNAIDEVISQLQKHLSKGDIIIDGGNSHYQDTINRHKKLKEIGIDFLGSGISGGEKGALLGPSIMVSGEKEVYNKVKNILEDISAKASDSMPCCAYIGKDGAGHYVKMVHNGIEYGDMQLICESYDILKNGLGLSINEIQTIFEKWNNGKLKSYLIEITSKILSKMDDTTEAHLIDMIKDKASQKGSGKWICIESINCGIAIPTILSSVYARYLSSKKEEREITNKVFSNIKCDEIDNKNNIIDSLENALYASKICCYAQGFDLLREASKRYNWNLDYANISTIWREGCIIRADFLDDIKNAYQNENINNLICSKIFSKILINTHQDLRTIANYSINKGISISAILSSLEYFDAYRTTNSTANLIQAQRDYFGSHGYERIDKEGVFHTNWEKIKSNK